MPMNFSLSGNSTFQIGESEGQFVITDSGALTFTAKDKVVVALWTTINSPEGATQR